MTDRHTTPQTVEALLCEVGLDCDLNIALTGLTDDSREVRDGSLFVAVPGIQVDGRKFITEAVAAGAVAIVTEGQVKADVPVISVPDARETLALLAQAYHGWPTQSMLTIGVTGTNGKTSMTFLIEAILREAKCRPGVMGTIESRFENIQWDAKTTTPGPIALAATARAMSDEGADALALEVSSHAIEQHRVTGIEFDAALFTNLSQDHLDYHGTMSDYAAVKRRLFTELLPQSMKPDRFAVVNIDDSEGRVIAEVCEEPVVTFGFADNADVRILSAALDDDGSDIVLEISGTVRELRTPLIGPANVMNVAMAVAWADRQGFSPEVIYLGLLACKRIPGRLEAVIAGQNFQIIVDYSHTPASLEGALLQCRTMTDEGASLRVVFGCGGDRDATKRVQMGHIAATLADDVWLTNDNPRTEDPETIADLAMEGIDAAGKTAHRELDRAVAIGGCLAAAQAGDVVLIAGKGHETYQEIGTERHPFDDAQVARQWLEANAS